MKQRILSVILMLTMLVALLPVGLPTAQAYSETDIVYPVEGGNIYFGKETGKITDCDEAVTKADIPTKIDGVAVTSIGRYAFSDCNSLTSVTIPEGVTSIGEGAFSDCSSLRSVTIPNSVTSIGDWAFYDCSSLTSVTIPNSVTIIGDWAFYDCSSLTSVTIPDGVTSIGIQAFYYCSSLTNVTIPDSVTSIGERALDGCSSLTSVTIPDSVTSIGDGAFSGCSSLTSVTIPNSVTSIGDGAFGGCSSLTSITIPESVMKIGEAAFSSCISLTVINVAEGNTAYCSENGVLFNKNKTTLLAYSPEKTDTEYRIPSSVTKIGGAAFSCCGSLTSITIPHSVTSIGGWAFAHCSGIASITIPHSVTSIGGYAFAYSGLTSVKIENGVTSIGDFVFSDCSSLTSVMIPDSVTNIGWAAFYGCSSLTSVTLSDSLTSIDDWAFDNCSSLSAVYLMGDAPALGAHAFQIRDEETQTVINIPGLTLYYIEGKEGWTTPEWNGYPTATWKPEEPTPPVEFVDVPQNEWYVGAVDYAVRNGLMGGTSANTFEPESAMTRAMLVTVLWRYEGKPMGYQNTFSDVNAKDGSWYIDAVAWAAANGIVGGVGNNKFDPDSNITREQMATILYRYAKKKGIDTSKRGDLSGFPDGGKVESWAKDAVQWTVAEKIIGGSEGYLLPQGNATRAQVATILMRFIENIVKK